MQKNIKRFFHPINQQMGIPDCEYDRTGLCIAMANALARNTNYSLYIIDYNRKTMMPTTAQERFIYEICAFINYIRLFWLSPAPVPLYLLLVALNLYLTVTENSLRS